MPDNPLNDRVDSYKDWPRSFKESIKSESGIERTSRFTKLDTTIRRLQKELEAIPQRRAEIEKEFDQRAFEIRALETRRDEAQTYAHPSWNEILEQTNACRTS